MGQYINKEEFRKDLREYREICKDWIEGGCEGVQPRLTDSLWLKFHELTTRIGSMPSYAQYPFAEEMISDAFDRCMKNAILFEPDAVVKDSGKLVSHIHPDTTDLNISFGALKLPTDGVVVIGGTTVESNNNILVVGGERIHYHKRVGDKFYNLERTDPMEHEKGSVVHFPTSPFSYFTATINHRFIQYIAREKQEDKKKEHCQTHFEMFQDTGLRNGSRTANFHYYRHFPDRKPKEVEEEEVLAEVDLLIEEELFY